MSNAANNFWGFKVAAKVSIEDALVAYAEADETGRALIETTGVTPSAVEGEAYQGEDLFGDLAA